jgi:hypothetical protein
MIGSGPCKDSKDPPTVWVAPGLDPFPLTITKMTLRGWTRP